MYGQLATVAAPSSVGFIASWHPMVLCINAPYAFPILKVDIYNYKEGFLQMQERPELQAAIILVPTEIIASRLTCSGWDPAFK